MPTRPANGILPLALAAAVYRGEEWSLTGLPGSGFTP